MARAQTGSPNLSNSVFLWHERTEKPLPKRKAKRDWLVRLKFHFSGPTVWVQKLQCEASSLCMFLTPLEACNSLCFLNCRVPWQQFQKQQSHNTRVETVRVLERAKKDSSHFKRNRKELGNAQIFATPSMVLEDPGHNRKRTSTQAGIKSKCHSQPTLPVYPNSIEHFCGPELMSDQRHIHWGHLLPSPTQGLAINAVKLASSFHGENTAHEIDLGLPDSVQNGVLKWNKYLALTSDYLFFWPSQKRSQVLTSRKKFEISSGLFTCKTTCSWENKWKTYTKQVSEHEMVKTLNNRNQSCPAVKCYEDLELMLLDIKRRL